MPSENEYPQKFFVFWITGSCGYGDRNGDVDEYDTLAEAIERKQELEKRDVFQVTIVEGWQIEV